MGYPSQLSIDHVCSVCDTNLDEVLSKGLHCIAMNLTAYNTEASSRADGRFCSAACAKIYLLDKLKRNTKDV